MEEIWTKLPYDLVRRILAMADLSIDTRLEFKVPPKKIFLKNQVYTPVFMRCIHLFLDIIFK